MPAVASRPASIPLWLWPNLLSLDAPLVAVLWMQLFARLAPAPVDWTASLVLALVVWLIYGADRLLDVSRGDAAVQESSRHRFCRTHRRAFLLLLIALLGLTCGLCSTLDHRTLRYGGLLLVLVAGYFAAVHRTGSRRFPKEAVVGVVFGLGVYLPVWAQLGTRPSAATAVCIVLFMLLCWLNAVLIEHSEWLELRHRRGQAPHALTVAAGTNLSAMGGAIATAAGLLTLLPAFHMDRLILLCLVLSTVALAALAAGRRKLPLDALRVLADATLLTPGLVLLFRR